MRTSALLFTLPFTLLLASAVPAQNLIVQDFAAAAFIESYGTSGLYPAMFPGPTNVQPGAPPLPVPAFYPPGGVTMDGSNGNLYFTDGAFLFTAQYNGYPGPVPAGFSLLGLPVGLFPPVPPIGPAPNVITGMALDPIGVQMGPGMPPTGPILFITDGNIVAGIQLFGAGAPFPVVPPMPVTTMAGTVVGGPVAPLTGLDWDPLTQTLWCCDVNGMAYNFTNAPPYLPGPLPPFTIINQIAPPLPMPTFGIAIDKTGLGFPNRPFYITGGGMTQDITNGTVATPIVVPNGGGFEAGLTYNPAPSAFPPNPPSGPGNVCPCANFPAYGVNLRGPMSVANAAWGLDVTGLPAGQLVVYAWDAVLAGAPPFPNINGIGCGFGLVLGSMSMKTDFRFANAAGTAFSKNFNLSLVPPGVQTYMQIGTFCPADPSPLGVVLSPLYNVQVSAF